MNFSDNAMCAILLCSYIGIKNDDTVKPMSLGEWNEFLDKIIAAKAEPGIVLCQNPKGLKKLQIADEEIERIGILLSRGGKVAFELEDLSKKGIGVVTIFDADYPVLLRRKLKRKAPPVLFYAGDLQLAKKIGIAVVGSRNIDEEGSQFTKKLVEKAAKEKLVIYSGGAKGVDITSEETAIVSGSAVVSFIADSLLSKIKKPEVIDRIMQGKLLLISDMKPDAGFSAARAMNRNKYIYASAYGAFVVASDYNKGGTWSGATEAMRNHWTKVMIWNHKKYGGNLKLIERGGIPYVLSEDRIYDVITKKENDFAQLDIFDYQNVSVVCEEKSEYMIACDESESTKDIYELIKNYIADGLGEGMDLDDTSKIFHVAKGQMSVWLKRLCKDGLVQCVDGIYRKIFI